RTRGGVRREGPGHRDPPACDRPPGAVGRSGAAPRGPAGSSGAADGRARRLRAASSPPRARVSRRTPAATAAPPGAVARDSLGSRVVGPRNRLVALAGVGGARAPAEGAAWVAAGAPPGPRVPGRAPPPPPHRPPPPATPP